MTDYIQIQLVQKVQKKKETIVKIICNRSLNDQNHIN